MARRHRGIAHTQRSQSFLTLALHEGQLSASDSGRFTHRKRTPGTRRTGCGVGPGIGQGIFDKGTSLVPAGIRKTFM